MTALSLHVHVLLDLLVLCHASILHNLIRSSWFVHTPWFQGCTRSAFTTRYVLGGYIHASIVYIFIRNGMLNGTFCAVGCSKLYNNNCLSFVHYCNYVAYLSQHYSTAISWFVLTLSKGHIHMYVQSWMTCDIMC